MMHKAWSSVQEVPYCFSRSSAKFEGHTAKRIVGFLPKLAISRLSYKFEFTNGYKIMHKAWSSIEEVPYCISMSSVKFQGHTGQKMLILTWIERFRTVTPVWIHSWLWNDAQSLMLYRRSALLLSKVIHPMSRSHGTKNHQFDPKWAFPDYKFSLNSPMD